MAAWNDNVAGGADTWGDSGNQVASDFKDPVAPGVTTSDTYDQGAGGDFSGNGGFGGNDGDNDGGANDGSCRNCGQDGHFARDCTEPRKMGACFNCGEEGHAKAECTNPRKFTGHRSSECPDRVMTCKNCKEEGHEALACTANRKLQMHHVADKLPEEAWDALQTASDEREITDFKEAVQVLVKASPEMTYVQLEKECRARDLSVYLIAMEKDHGDTFTVVNLQGEIGKKYTVGYFLSDKPQRPSMKERWPASAEENLARLENAGIPMDRGITKCGNCNELGHSTRACPQEREVYDKAIVKCALCDEEGHRVRDCTQERRKPGGAKECRVCQGTDHMAKDCPNREKRTCKNCGSEDHLAKECDQPRPCRNCDATGHVSRDCPEPKNWSRVKCQRCGEMGHTVVRCKQPDPAAAPEDEENAAAAAAVNNGGGNGGGGLRGFDDNTIGVGAAAPDSWDSEDHQNNAGGNFANATPVAVAPGDGGW